MQVKAKVVAQKLKQKNIAEAFEGKVVLESPLVIRLSETKFLVFLSFGVLVLWDLESAQEQVLMGEVANYFEGIFDEPYQEITAVGVGAKVNAVATDGIVLKDADPKKIALVSVVLGCSAALSHFEEMLEVFTTHLGSVISKLRKHGDYGNGHRKLLKDAAIAMEVRHQALHQVRMLQASKIEGLDKTSTAFYNDMIEEYELETRYEALVKKIGFLNQDTEFIFGLLQNRWIFWFRFLSILLIILILLQVLLFAAEVMLTH